MKDRIKVDGSRETVLVGHQLKTVTNPLVATTINQFTSLNEKTIPQPCELIFFSRVSSTSSPTIDVNGPISINNINRVLSDYKLGEKYLNVIKQAIKGDKVLRESLTVNFLHKILVRYKIKIFY